MDGAPQRVHVLALEIAALIGYIRGVASGPKARFFFNADRKVTQTSLQQRILNDFNNLSKIDRTL
jgi:hypothetical protein